MTSPDRPPVTITAPGRPDLLGDVVGPPERSGWRPDLRNLAAAAIGVVGVGVAGTGIALAVALAGGGAQPESVLPADTFAMAKVDLDPSADQKLAALALAERYPDVEADDVRNVKDALLRRLFEDSEVDYDRQVAPWIGARAAVAVRPDTDDDGQPDVLLAVAYEDRDEAERRIPELIEQADDDAVAAYAFSARADYVLFAPSQEAADAAAEPDEVLADAEAFAADLAGLAGDQVAVAWADLGTGWSGIGPELRDFATAAYGEEFEASGRYITGVHLERDAIEVAGAGVELDFGSDAVNAYLVPEARGTGLAEELPEGAVGAFSVAGFGDQMAGLLELTLAQASAGLSEEDLATVEEVYGIAVPEDLPLLFGSETAVGVYDDEGLQVGVRTRSDDAPRATALVQQVLDAVSGSPDALSGGFSEEGCRQAYDELVELGEVDPDVEPVEDFCGGIEPQEPVEPAGPLGLVEELSDGVGFATNADLLRRLGQRGGLGGTRLYERAVPDVDGAATVAFADVQRLVPLLELDDQEWLAPVRAVGATAEAGSAARFRLRVLFE